MFIELNRTFHELTESDNVNDSGSRLFFSGGETLNWNDLVQEYRVVLLSEAGSGKTEEIRHIAQRLRNEGKPAFFIRLEHIAHDFESAFEEGTYEEFVAWQMSDGEAWLLLDSVDEARLRNPSDFEAAVRKLAHYVLAEKQRVHIVITGRTSAWRPKTDLVFCGRHLPYIKPTFSANEVDGVAGEKSQIQLERRIRGQEPAGFRIVAFDDLKPSQVEIFAKARGVTNAQAFLDAVERADAWLFTSRPLDLEELVEFWNDHSRIGNRLELMKNSIERRLQERDEDRAEARPLKMKKVHEGAMLIAAASTLAHEPTIQVPDGSHNSKGLRVKSLLSDWDDVECATLLARPIFDEAIYGTVRFHHRSVREYLTAEWFAALLNNQTSRRNIEEIFFREQYGQEVVVPAMRPVLPWLAIFDEKIRNRICRIAPEILFEGGDPSQLPLETRRRILQDVCEQLADGTSIRSTTDLAAVQRFANIDLTPDIKELIRRFDSHDELLWFLLRMVWQGELIGALPEARQVARTTSLGHHARVAAIRAVSALGAGKDKSELREAFLNESDTLNRDLLAALLEGTIPTTELVQWLIHCLRKVEEKQRFHVDPLVEELCGFLERSSDELLPLIVEAGNSLLEEAPVVERRHCEISVKYSWLLKPIAIATKRLVKLRNPAALHAPCLAVLRKIPILKTYDPIEFTDTKLGLGELVAGWPELNLALFWYLAEDERTWLNREQKRLTDWWNVGILSSYVSFSVKDIESILTEIKSRPFIDDKLVALSLAFKLYVEAGRPPKVRAQLRVATRGEAELTERLAELMRPVQMTEEVKKWKRQEAGWKRKAKQNREREERNREGWRRYVIENVELLRDPGLNEPDAISNAQHYLHCCMREGTKNSGDRSHGNWPILEDEFGLAVARAFRDGAVAYWRRNRPMLVSEGAATNVTAFSTIFGLTGLAIEASETPEWPAALSESEAELAFRYAMHELNGFPPWMPRLFLKFPDVIRQMSLREITYELATEDERKESFYLLYDVSWSGDWLWDAIAPCLLERLSVSEPGNLRNLGYLLNVIQGSNLTDEKISHLASEKLNSFEQPDRCAYWFAVWTGVAPDKAIPALEQYLNSLKSSEERTLTAMIYVTQLLGGRRSGSSQVREAYRTPTHLKSLYLLMHRHIKRNEDIERANSGVYSPGLRDDAQDARDRLFGLLKEIPGKDAFLAIQEIASVHPDERSRPWFTVHARAKAESDADNPPWPPAQVREFYDEQERTPAFHRDLFDLAAMRMRDLKNDLENGDSSIASILKGIDDEIEIRKYIGGWCRDCAKGRYSIPQEEELADAKRPDFRWHGVGFDAPVPMELKLADNWTGPALFERLRVQLCGDYLRDIRSGRGLFVLVYRGEKKAWELPGNRSQVAFDGLVEALQIHWEEISCYHPGVDEVRVIGIDLTKRDSAAE